MEKKILVIEDTESILNAIKTILKMEGYSVITAKNGKLGIALAESHLPDLIICDIMMPEVNGYDVLKKLRENQLTSLIPFVFLTAKTSMTELRHGMELGADDYIPKPFSSEDIINSVKTRLEKHEKLINFNLQKVSELSEELKRERELSLTDFLTGISNRRGFFQKAEIELERAKRHGYPLTVVYFDIDNFKTVNDFFGHETGDMVLMNVSQCIINGIRLTDIFARMGGDEFVIIFPEADYENCMQIIERINKQILAIMSENKLPVTLSIGIVTFKKFDLPVLEIINIADGYMYQSKKIGKNRISGIVIE